MQDFIGSVRRSLVFKPSAAVAGEDNGAGIGGIVEKIGSTIRRSRIGMFSSRSPPLLHHQKSLPIGGGGGDVAAAKIRWRKGELIGCGAFGRVYMGMNLDSGELIVVKQAIVVKGCHVIAYGISPSESSSNIRILAVAGNLASLFKNLDLSLESNGKELIVALYPNL